LLIPHYKLGQPSNHGGLCAVARGIALASQKTKKVLSRHVVQLGGILHFTTDFVQFLAQLAEFIK